MVNARGYSSRASGMNDHPGTALVGGVMMAYVFLNLGRIVFFASVSPSDNVFTVSAYDVFMYLAYQVLVIAPDLWVGPDGQPTVVSGIG